VREPKNNVRQRGINILNEGKRIPAAWKGTPVRAGAVETARAGRAAWGVLGSAAGGHVLVLAN